MITLEHVYILSGVFLAAYAVLSARDASNPKRFGNAAFWGLLAASFLFGSHLGDFANGLIAIALIAIGGLKLMHRGAGATTTPQERQARAGAWQRLVRAGADHAGNRTDRHAAAEEFRSG